jgi:hypothetical protein
MSQAVKTKSITAAQFKKINKNAKDLHKVWNDFYKRFYPTVIVKPGKKFNKPYAKLTVKQKIAVYPKVKNVWKWIGYDLMTKVEAWAKKNPSVRIAYCDDAVHSSSYLVFIPHETKKEYFGTSVVLIPQCSGEEPSSYFLYPNHLDKIESVIKDIQKNTKNKIK